MSESLDLLEEDIRPTITSKRETGDRGERLAAEFLQKNGYRIVMANFEAPIGRNSREVQIIGEIWAPAYSGLPKKSSRSISAGCWAAAVIATEQNIVKMSSSFFIWLYLFGACTRQEIRLFQ